MSVLVDEEKIHSHFDDLEIKNTAHKQEFSKEERRSYNLKEELQELVGLTDFSKKLNEVNFIISIIVLLGLFAYFIL